MLISNRKAVFLLFFYSCLLIAAEVNSSWSEVETIEKKNKAEVEKQVEKDAETVARNEKALWNALNAEKAKKIEMEAKIKAEGEARKKTEEKQQETLSSQKTERTAEAQTSNIKHNEREDSKNEADLLIEQDRAKTAAAEKQLQDEISRKNTRTEADLLIEQDRAKTAAAEKRLTEKKQQPEVGTAEKETAGISASDGKEKSAQPPQEDKKESAQPPQEDKKESAQPPQEDKKEKIADDNGPEKKSWLSKAGNAVVWYIPNRLLDLIDIFTAEIGFGEFGIDLYLTRQLAFGAGVGQSYMLGWSFARQYGIYSQREWYADLLNYRTSFLLRESVCGSYRPISNIFDFKPVDMDRMDIEKAESYFAVGIKACCILNIKFQIHPIEIADFIAGFFFIDFKEDDIGSSSSDGKDSIDSK